MECFRTRRTRREILIVLPVPVVGSIPRRILARNAKVPRWYRNWVGGQKRLLLFAEAQGWGRGQQDSFHGKDAIDRNACRGTQSFAYFWVYHCMKLEWSSRAVAEGYNKVDLLQMGQMFFCNDYPSSPYVHELPLEGEMEVGGGRGRVRSASGPSSHSVNRKASCPLKNSLPQICCTKHHWKSTILLLLVFLQEPLRELKKFSGYYWKVRFIPFSPRSSSATHGLCLSSAACGVSQVFRGITPLCSSIL